MAPIWPRGGRTSGVYTGAQLPREPTGTAIFFDDTFRPFPVLYGAQRDESPDRRNSSNAKDPPRFTSSFAIIDDLHLSIYDLNEFIISHSYLCRSFKMKLLLLE
uniref:Uncharacterized protein n=1 Tax=Vespula pensylvanica TaxID=30213 RepID=A0A834PAQ1_VESPE|nr:hypothetical protein H0235_002724 [Vespula pensylvanica]